MKVAEYVIELLSDAGIDTIFGQIGGFNADLIDAIAVSKKQKFVLTYHEQGAAFAANAYAMVRGDISVAISSGAPSSCNLIGGIANAFFDSIPCLFIAGSVHVKSLRKSPNIRQNAFEEIDMVSLTSEITKYAVKVTNPMDIRYYLEKAIYIAKQGRKGPVLIDLPYDVARSDINVAELKTFIPEELATFDQIDEYEILNLLETAKKPLILLGGGCRSDTSRYLVKKLLDKVSIPAVASLCGLDILPDEHPCYFGFIGHYGNRYANFAIANCDCLIVLGSRLDERQIAGDKSKFAGNADIVRVDIDKVELDRIEFKHDGLKNIKIHSSIENFLENFLKIDLSTSRYDKWLQVISGWKEQYPSFETTNEVVNANNFLHAISDYFPENLVITVDVGQNQMFAAQSLRLKKSHILLNTGGYGSMGFSLPAAIGAAYAHPSATILSINGDGGLLMNIQELQVVRRDKLPIKIIVLNNNCLGMIRRLQERIYEDRTTGSVHGYQTPDYSSIAPSYGLEYVQIDSVDDFRLVDDLLKTPSAVLIELQLPQNIINNPEPGAAIDLQTPLLSINENEKIKKDCDF